MSKEGYNTAFALPHVGTRIGVYGICICDNRVLMVKTQSGSRSIYNFPGGGAEDYERFIDTLKRECLEEIGCDITVGDLLCTSGRLYKHPDFPNNNFHLYYVISLKAAFDKSIQDAQWFDINNLPLDKMLEIDKAIVHFIKI